MLRSSTLIVAYDRKLNLIGTFGTSILKYELKTGSFYAKPVFYLNVCLISLVVIQKLLTVSMDTFNFRQIYELAFLYYNYVVKFSKNLNTFWAI